MTAKHIASFVLLVCLCAASAAIAQDNNPKTPNSVLRNNDFQDRRQTDEPVNFGKEYYDAHSKTAKASGSLGKGEDEWTPIGPFGKTRLAGNGRINTMQFHPTDTNTWYVCVAQGGLWKTTNAGQSWISISGDLPILRTSYLAVHPTNADTMYVAMGDFAYLGHNLQANENKRNSHYGLGVYKSVDGGQTWKPTALSFAQTDFEGSLIAKILINKDKPNTVIAVGQTGCYLTENGGESWTKTRDGLFWDLEQHPNKNNDIIATIGYVHSYKYGTVNILRSSDFGKTWQISSTPIPASGVAQRVEVAYAPSNPSYVYAIACDTAGGLHGFYRSTDEGKTFSTRYNKIYNLLGWSFDQEPGGQGRYDLAICVDRYNADRVLIGGVNIWQTSNGGTSFEPVSLWSLNYAHISVHADIHEIVQHPTNNSFFVSHDGGLSRTFEVIPDKPETLEDDRKSSTKWTHYSDGMNITSFYRLSVNPADSKEIIAGAQDNSTVHTDGTKFRNLSGGDGMESAFDDQDYYRYTSSQYGYISAFFPQGNSFDREWLSITSPSSERGEWTTPMIHANGQLYILYGNVYTATGSSLSSSKSNFEIVNQIGIPRPGTALAVEKKSAQRIYVAKRGYNSLNIDNEMQTTSDGGQNWTNIGSGLPSKLYPSYLDMNQSDPSQAWITFSGFDSIHKVFKTSNAGKDWTNITYDLPNIPVNCVAHQNDGGTTVYIGTDLGVYYLEAGTTSWIPFSDGLPKVIVSELEVDVNNKTLVAATFGRGLWEIGLHNFVVGIDQKAMPTMKFAVMPNPASNEIAIDIQSNISAFAKLKIVDITGRILLDKDIKLPQTSSQIIDVSNYLPGAYFVIFSQDGQRRVTKFIKQ